MTEATASMGVNVVRIYNDMAATKLGINIPFRVGQFHNALLRLTAFSYRSFESDPPLAESQ